MTLSPEEQSRLGSTREVDPDAYEAYLRGRAAWRRSGGFHDERVIAYFREAIRIDPEYALAHAGLADVYLTIAHFERPPHEAMPLAKEQALKALELDPSLAQAHAAYADAVFHYDWDWELAEQEFRRAIELNPGYEVAHWWYSGLLAALGRHEEAAREIAIAQELDPMPSPGVRAFALRIHYWARQPERIAATAERFARHDQQIDMGALMGVVIFSRAMQNEAVPRDQIERIRGELEQRPLAAVELAAIEDTPESRAALRRLETIYERRYISPYMIAIGWAFLGEDGRALNWLEKALDDRAADLIWVNVEPAFDSLRNEPRFKSILKEMNFPKT